VILLDPNGHFLLFLSHFEPGSDLPPRWVFPGGGLEPGETELEGIRRELHEETGLLVEASKFSNLGIQLEHEMEDKRKHDTGTAHFFELQVPAQFEPSKEFWTQDEHRDTVTHRWWSYEEILIEDPWIGPDGAIDLLHNRFGNPEA
jgi:8-oxo-dGTP pyrophosphatase MutT (NUDIX family)